MSFASVLAMFQALLYQFDSRGATIDYEKALDMPGVNEMLSVPPEAFAWLPTSQGCVTHDFSQCVPHLPSLVKLLESFMESAGDGMCYATFRVRWPQYYQEFRTKPTMLSWADQATLVLPPSHEWFAKKDAVTLITDLIFNIRGSFEYGEHGILLAAIPECEIESYFKKDRADVPVRQRDRIDLPPEYFLELFAGPTQNEQQLLDHLIRKYWLGLSARGYVPKGRLHDVKHEHPWEDEIPDEIVSSSDVRIDLGGDWGFRGILEGWHRLEAIQRTINAHRSKS